jgi:exopolysaccharide biosynthesis polyprenyl glycosylphosphotransferase
MATALLNEEPAVSLPPYRRLMRRCAPAARRTLLPGCDGFTLLMAAVFTVSGWLSIGYTTAALLLLNVTGRHRLRICLRVSDEVPRLAAAAVLPVPLLLLWIPSAASALLLTIVATGSLLIERTLLYTFLRAAHRRGRLTEPALIVGTGKLGTEIGSLLQEHTELGLRPVGFIGDPGPDFQYAFPVLGDVPAVSEAVSAYNVRRIIASFAENGDASLVSALRAPRLRSVDVCVVPRLYELAPAVPPGCLDEIWGIPLMPLRPSGLPWYGRAVKRGFDLVGGAVLLIVLTPLLLVLMGLIRLTCGRPVLYQQVRTTRSGRPMTIMKLRTVTASGQGERWSVSPEDCSSLGRWLRATHLDELPQLLNVLRGEMSLVGPRPERPSFTAHFAATIPRYEDRLRANGGMTGWAQVHGLVGDTSIEERVRFDNYYLEHWSLWLDLIVLVRTVLEPLSGARTHSRARADAPAPPVDHGKSTGR